MKFDITRKVFSLLGVILIARPQASFGSSLGASTGDGHGAEGVPELADGSDSIDDNITSMRHLLTISDYFSHYCK